MHSNSSIGLSSGSFWQSPDQQHDQLMVVDTWRHRQVANPESSLPPGPHLAGPRALGTLDTTLGGLAAEMERNRGYSSQQKPPERALQPSGVDGQSMVSLGDLHLSHGSGLTSMPLDTNPSSALHPTKSVAEVSNRRRDAIKASFRRVDIRNQGWVSLQDLTVGLQRFSGLTALDQERVCHGIAGNSPQRITFAQFSVYYQLLGSTIERDRDFEDLMRHHWGFPEVSDILEDMKNKFAMVGLAYTFRHALQQGNGAELSLEAFAASIKQVGMAYSPAELNRVFDSFDMSGMGHASNLEVLKLTAHLTSAARPGTPVPIGYGSAHFSEVHSQAELSDLHHSTGSLQTPSLHNGSSLYGGMHGAGMASSASHSGMMHQYGQQHYGGMGNHYSGMGSMSGMSHHHGGMQGSTGLTAGGKLAEPPTAPPETTEAKEDDGNPNAPPPAAPPEEDDEGAVAPPENAAHNRLGYPPPPEAPPEEEGGDLPPEEAPNPQDDDAVEAPSEHGRLPALSKPGGGQSHYGHLSGSSLSHHPIGDSSGRPTAGGGHASAVAAANNGVMSGTKRAVTVGINYLSLPRGQGQLDGCINDSDTFIKLLTEEFQYRVEDIRQLRDDHPKRMPTRKNMQAALNWLVNGAKEGDHLFFHYSGHGTQKQDTSGDEMDGKDECLVPCDFQHSGMISDDDIRRLIVAPLAKGVRLTVILDCCHSGTAMDLPYKVILHTDGVSADIKKKSPSRMPMNPTEADVVMLSGCKDTQTSADIGAGAAGNTKAAGAMTTAFKTIITNHPTATYHDMLIQMRKFLKQRGFQQVPQLNSEHFLNLTECFMPEVEPPCEAPAASLRPGVMKAVSIGINYLTLWPGRGRLSGCINDSDTMKNILKDTFGFQDSMICQLRDDQPNMMPTKANIMKALQWLCQGAANGDELFLHYSGHGGQQKDLKGDEADGKDETLIPCDFQQAGQITDDELHRVLLGDMPKGVRMWVILDCCHSGTALDLRYKVQISADGNTTRMTKSRAKREKKATEAEVIMISGCKDEQTSADIGAGTAGAAKASGAMTTAFRHCINRQITCQDLLHSMRVFLKQNRFDQVPQMGSEQFVQLDHSFVDYQMKKRTKRALPPSQTTRSLRSTGAPPPHPAPQSFSSVPQQSFSGSSPQQNWRPVQEMPLAPSQMPLSPMGGGGNPTMFGHVSADDYVLGTRIHRIEEEIAKLRHEGGGQQSFAYPMQAPMQAPMQSFGMGGAPMAGMGQMPPMGGGFQDPMQMGGGPPAFMSPGFM
mmetsp:Transcript_125164/g.227676  ORF Transcript_125164/g.227676 Transcript_125164/m.227676 type:complete len:1266 (-) Transcript_125164:175-3972(-)